MGEEGEILTDHGGFLRHDHTIIAQQGQGCALHQRAFCRGIHGGNETFDIFELVGAPHTLGNALNDGFHTGGQLLLHLRIQGSAGAFHDAFFGNDVVSGTCGDLTDGQHHII